MRVATELVRSVMGCWSLQLGITMFLITGQENQRLNCTSIFRFAGVRHAISNSSIMRGTGLDTKAVCQHLGVLSPVEVRGIRKRYEMNRSEFAQVTGLGEATLNRWENGTLVQNRANDRYLRLLAIPEVMNRLTQLLAARFGLVPGAGCAAVSTSFACWKFRNSIVALSKVSSLG